MLDWQPEPYWETLSDRLQALALVAITAGDTLAPVLHEYARLPRLARTDFRNLDKLKSLMGQGVVGVIVRG